MQAVFFCLITVFTLLIVALLAVQLPNTRPITLTLLSTLALIAFLAALGALGVSVSLPAFLN